MRKIIFLFLLVSFYSFSQNNNDKFIEGIVYNDNSYSIQGVHVLNVTSNEATITDSEGNFKILVNLNDELIFSAIQFKRNKIIIDKDVFDSLSITIYLEEFVNELDEVILNSSGLSGSLMNDLQNTGIVKDLNFDDIGIPGYTGPQKTQSQRRLNEATTGSGIIPLNPIINAITGRTKMLKKRIKLERTDNLINSIKDRLSGEFFQNNLLHEDFRMDFLYYCSEDSEFEQRCKNKSDIEVVIFLKEKLIMYKQNLSETKN